MLVNESIVANSDTGKLMYTKMIRYIDIMGRALRITL